MRAHVKEASPPDQLSDISARVYCGLYSLMGSEKKRGDCKNSLPVSCQRQLQYPGTLTWQQSGRQSRRMLRKKLGNFAGTPHRETVRPRFLSLCLFSAADLSLSGGNNRGKSFLTGFQFEHTLSLADILSLSVACCLAERGGKI